VAGIAMRLTARYDLAGVQAKRLLTLIRKAGFLKRIQRAGWRVRGIEEAESVADHSYRVSLLAMLLADSLAGEGQVLDREKVLRMALLHDLAESEIGDIPMTALSYLGEQNKRDAESRAIEGLTSPLGKTGESYREIWDEFEAGQSLEARLVRAADKLEMLIQALEYEAVGYRCLNEFWRNEANRPFFEEFPVISEIVALLERDRIKNQ
jgi:putative hydrolase of HD superfamily